MMGRIEKVRQRFMSDPKTVRLGSIASDLSRLAYLAGERKGPVFNSVLREVKLFTEWTASDLDLEMQKMVLNLQRRISNLDAFTSKKGLSKEAERWSRKILIKSGMVRRFS